MSLPTNRDQLRERCKQGESFQFYLFYGHKPPITGVDESCLSQWFEREFDVDGIRYSTAEHWMMAEKARLFDDQEMLEAILECKTPKEAKAIGRKVSGFDNETWGEKKFEIVIRGNLAKFKQHADLKQFLLGTARPNQIEHRAVAETKESYLDGKESTADSHQDSGEAISERLGIYRVEGQDASVKSSDVTANPTAISKTQSNVILVEAAGRDAIWGIGLGMNNPKSKDPFSWRGLNLLGFALTSVRETLASQEARS